MGQAASNATIFTITGEVLIRRIAIFCTASLTEGAPTAQLSMGTNAISTLLLAALNSVLCDVGEWVVDGTPVVEGKAIPAGMIDILIAVDIIIRNTTQDTDGGTLEITCWWEPVSDDGDLVAA